MHHSFIDKYSGLESTIHRLDPRIKIPAAALAIIIIVATPPVSFTPFAIYAAVALALWIASRLPFSYLLSRIAITVPFVAVMTVGIAFGQWEFFIFILIRAVLSLTFLILLTSTTKFPLLLEGLRWYRLPKVLHSLLSFIYRFIYIIIDEFHRLNRGRQSRETGGSLKLSWRGRGWMLGSFLIRSIERSERVYSAMLARGYAHRR